MHILITNDDGIFSSGIRTLADCAIRRGHRVTISAPSRQCSANSQHITLTSPILTHRIDWPGAEAWAVDGTPADCVRILADQLQDKPDLCLSGINDGENAGPAVYYSGTVAAAREAATMYIPAVAVSIMRGSDEAMRRNLAEIALTLGEQYAKMPQKRFTVMNLNAPAVAPEKLGPLTLCPLSQAYYLDGYEERASPHGQPYYWLRATDSSGLPMEPVTPGSDYAFLQEGRPTCTFVGPYIDYNADFSVEMQRFMK